METQLEAQNIVPQELEWMVRADANTWRQALEILMSNKIRRKGLMFKGPFKVESVGEQYLKLLPKAIGMNTTMQQLEFYRVEVNDILMAEVIRAAVRKNKVTCIVFGNCKVNNQRLVERVCEAFKERSTAFQLQLERCSPEFANPILEASYLKCFSLKLWDVDCSQIRCSLKNSCLKGSLYYITLRFVKGLKADFFLYLGRCLIPNLTKLDLFRTEVPTSALKRLHGSLRTILDSGRSNVFQRLDLGITEVDEKLSYIFFRLLRSDLVRDFRLRVKKDISRAVVKSISATVAKTKNLTYLKTWNNFSSGTKFNNFKLQEKEKDIFRSPFGVNPS